MNFKLSTSPRLGWRGWSAIGLVVWAGALQLAMMDTQSRHKDVLQELEAARERAEKPWRYKSDTKNDSTNE